ncbi:MAG: FkbM family methyltransferase [Patescibacteria group bacterium]|nr:FkbM family methyltransferase [Patescibacteria group bacterium]
MSEIFFSQFGQDKWLDETVFRGKRNGIFVEAGALDGISDSNSAFFEKFRGWSGLLVEPNVVAFQMIGRNRPTTPAVCAALYDRNGIVEFTLVSTAGWSGVADDFEPQHKERIAQSSRTSVTKVPCLTLYEAVTGLPRIDYLSLDLEGAEPTVLKPFPFNAMEIDVIGVENNYGDERVQAILGAAGYEKIGRVGPDDFYRRPQ